MTMQGSPAVPFSALFADTVEAHGVLWAWDYYTRRGMGAWEFDFWLRATGVWSLFGRD